MSGALILPGRQGGSLMVVPSGLVDSLNLPGMLGAKGMVPHANELADGESAQAEEGAGSPSRE